jgi:hypothetical protein
MTQPTRHPYLALVVLGALLVAGQSGMSELEKAQAEYAARQERLRCQAHPEQGCLTRPESENEKAMREYRERQERIRDCTYDEQDVCR